MPLLYKGKVISGVGGGRGNIALDGTVPAALQDVWGGSAVPLNDQTIVFNGSTDGVNWKLHRFDTDLSVLIERDGYVAARNDVWAARNPQGYFDVAGREAPTWGNPVVSPFGDIITHKNPWGVDDLIKIDRSGTQSTLLAGIPNPFHVFAGRNAILVHRAEDNQVYAIGAPNPSIKGILRGAMFDERPLGQRWIGGDYEWSGGRGLIIQPWFDPVRAILVSSDEQDFWPSMEFRATGLLWVVTAETQGEQPDRLRCWQFNLVSMERRLVRVGGEVLRDWEPIVTLDLTKPTVPVPPLPPPPPPPMPIPIPIPDISEDLKVERTKYGPMMTNDECVLLLNAVAARNSGWGLHSKPSGNNGSLPDGTKVSIDWLIYQPAMKGSDVIQDAGGVSEISFSTGDFVDVDPAVFIPPQGGSVPVPPPVPPPTPPPPSPVCKFEPCECKFEPTDLSKITEAIVLMAQELARLRQQVAIINQPKKFKGSGSARFIGTINFTGETIKDE